MLKLLIIKYVVGLIVIGCCFVGGVVILVLFDCEGVFDEFVILLLLLLLLLLFVRFEFDLLLFVNELFLFVIVRFCCCDLGCELFLDCVVVLCFDFLFWVIMLLIFLVM